MHTLYSGRLRALCRNAAPAFSITLFPFTLVGQSAVQLFQRIEPSIAFIQTDSGGGGTGFCIARTGLVATSLHVVDGAKTVSLSFKSRSTIAGVELLAADTVADLAILRAPGLVCAPVTLGDSDRIQTGQKVFVIGNPLARRELAASISDGLVSGVRTLEGKQRVVQVSAPLSPGNSGGPVLSDTGEVIGIVAFKMPRGELLNFAVPVNDLKTLADNSGDKPIHSWTASESVEYRSSAYRIGDEALAIFERASRVLGTCELEDAAWEETVSSRDRTAEAKRFQKREFGSIRVYSRIDENGQRSIITEGKGLHGRWQKVNGKLTQSSDLREDDIISHLADDWYCFCPGTISMWRSVEAKTVNADGTAASEVRVKDPFYGSTLAFTFANDTGFLIKKRFVTKSSNGPVTITQSFSDFRRVDKFVISFSSVIETSVGGYAEVKIKSFSSNNGYPDYFFDK